MSIAKFVAEHKEAFDNIVETAVDEGLHDLMAVCAFIGDGDMRSGILSPDGPLGLEDVLAACVSAFHSYVKYLDERGDESA